MKNQYDWYESIPKEYKNDLVYRIYNISEWQIILPEHFKSEIISKLENQGFSIRMDEELVTASFEGDENELLKALKYYR